jgi:hypothetical protein
MPPKRFQLIEISNVTSALGGIDLRFQNLFDSTLLNFLYFLVQNISQNLTTHTKKKQILLHRKKTLLESSNHYLIQVIFA